MPHVVSGLKVGWTIPSGPDYVNKLIGESLALVGGIDHPPSSHLELLKTLNEMGRTNSTLVIKRLQVTSRNYTLSVDGSRSRNRCRSTTHGT